MAPIEAELLEDSGAADVYKRQAYGNMQQTFGWFDLETTQKQFEEQLEVIEVAAKALGY